MRKYSITGRRPWKLFKGTSRTQAAEMVIPVGESEGGRRNRHARSDQWLFVLAGTGLARVQGRRIRLKPGSLLLIERGERHQITATGRQPLKTVNVYGPPAY